MTSKSRYLMISLVVMFAAVLSGCGILEALLGAQDEEYVITLTQTAGGTISLSPEADSYLSGTKVTLTATPDSLHEFGEWAGDANGDEASIEVTVAADMVISATWLRLPRWRTTEYLYLPADGSTFTLSQRQVYHYPAADNNRYDTRSIYDASGVMTKIREYLYNSLGQRVRYDTYDITVSPRVLSGYMIQTWDTESGNLESQVYYTPAGVVTGCYSYSCDAAGRDTGFISSSTLDGLPEDGSYTIAYNAEGKETSASLWIGNQGEEQKLVFSSFVYDAEDRLIKRIGMAESDASVSAEWAYTLDDDGNVLTEELRATREGTTCTIFKYVNTYDDHGNCTSYEYSSVDYDSAEMLLLPIERVEYRYEEYRPAD